jgi:hypothetical protein
MALSVSDMLPDDEGLGSKMNPRTPKCSAEADAGATAKAMLKGGAFLCSRIGAEVYPKNCLKRYKEAQEAGAKRSPCLECAKVQVVARKLQFDPAGPVFNRKPTEDIVTPATLKKVEPERGPFPGWQLFDPREVVRPGDVFARIGKTSMTFSAAAVTELELNSFDSVDVYHAPGKLGLHFREGRQGVFVLTRETRGGRIRKLSCSSLVKGLSLDGAKDQRLPLVKRGPGLVEIDLGKGPGL